MSLLCLKCSNFPKSSYKIVHAKFRRTVVYNSVAVLWHSSFQGKARSSWLCDDKFQVPYSTHWLSPSCKSTVSWVGQNGARDKQASRSIERWSGFTGRSVASAQRTRIQVHPSPFSLMSSLLYDRRFKAISFYLMSSLSDNCFNAGCQEIIQA